MTIHTSVLTPTHIFQNERQLRVPLFQRPYTWNRTEQWEPLWSDVARLAERCLPGSPAVPRPHFLGAIVLQQVASGAGDLDQRMIIDGQQRMTTLQLLIDAVHAELLRAEFTTHAAKLIGLIENGEVFRRTEQDMFKLWPTNLDRPAFQAVMAATAPIDYAAIPEEHHHSKFFQAHKFFADSCKSWLLVHKDAGHEAADALVKTLRELLQVVVIDLDAGDDAQEIFETLNARGARLEASDLIKNFVFQRLLEEDVDIDKFYRQYWFKFETSFWVQLVNAGREKWPRSSLFMYHWLIAQTAEDLTERQIFARFKEYVLDSGLTMSVLIERLSRAADVYEQKIVRSGESLEGNLDQLGMFVYRMAVMETTVHRPVLLDLFDPDQPAVPEAQVTLALRVLESWFARRMLIRGGAKAYNKLMVDALVAVRGRRDGYGAALQRFFASQKSLSSYWPDDDEIRSTLSSMNFYGRIGKSRQRMILEAIEDHRRGWIGKHTSPSGTRVKRGTFQVEHVMPQSWKKTWPLGPEEDPAKRDAAIQTLGNLTLLTGKLNVGVSNGSWLGERGKRASISKHDLLQLNKELLAQAGEVWDERAIEARGREMVHSLIEIWPAPEGHKVQFAQLSQDVTGDDVYVEVSDLLTAGLVQAGQLLFAKQKKHDGKTAEIMADGRIAVGSEIFDTLSGAGQHIRGRATNGWTFWLTDVERFIRMADIRAQYRDSLALEPSADDDQASDEADDLQDSTVQAGSGS